MADTSSTSSAAESTSSVAPSSSSAPPSSSSAPPSSSAPESSASPSQSSISTSGTTSASQSASVSASASASATPSSASATSSGATSAPQSSAGTTTQHTVTSTLFYTSVDGNGSTVTGSSLSVGAEQTGSSGGGTNTGAIVGGVVGGVAGLVILAALAWFLLRKRRKSHRAEFDDMMFDPSRAQNHGAIDLADNSVSPYVAPGVASTAQSPEMTQYARSQTSDGNYGYEQDLSRNPSTATSSAGFAGRGAGAYPHGMPSSPPPMPTIHAGAEAGAVGAAGAAGAAGGAMSAKQREAFNEQQRFRVANQGYAGPSGPGAPSSSGAVEGEPGSPGSGNRVTVHEDGGAASEIPPTYDSIRR